MHVNHIVHRRSPMPDTQGVASLRHAAARQKQRGSKARLGYRVRLQIEYGRSFSGHPARRRHGVALQARCRTGSRRWNVLCCGIELLGNGIEVALHQAASSDRMASAAERNLRRPTALALTRAVHRQGREAMTKDPWASIWAPQGAGVRARPRSDSAICFPSRRELRLLPPIPSS
jgi:hypothetical protein